MTLSTLRLTLFTLLTLLATQDRAEANGGDECWSRTFITGTGLFAFDTYGMTTSSVPVSTYCLSSGTVKNDVWYEWTVPSDGGYRFTTVGHTNVNTQLVVYVNANTCLPANPTACNDNAPNCGPCCTQSRIDLCDLSAGDTVKIRLGSCGYAGFGDLEILPINCDTGGGTGDGGLGTTYCEAAPSSILQPAGITGTGTGSTNDDSFELSAGPIPPGQYGLFYYGDGQSEVPFGDGFRCVSPGPLGVLIRFPVQQASACGFSFLEVFYDSLPAGSPGFAPGSTWFFQHWYRDPLLVGGSGFNLSNGLSITFLP